MTHLFYHHPPAVLVYFFFSSCVEKVISVDISLGAQVSEKLDSHYFCSRFSFNAFYQKYRIIQSVAISILLFDFLFLLFFASTEHSLKFPCFDCDVDVHWIKLQQYIVYIRASWWLSELKIMWLSEKEEEEEKKSAEARKHKSYQWKSIMP